MLAGRLLSFELQVLPPLMFNFVRQNRIGKTNRKRIFTFSIFCRSLWRKVVDIFHFPHWMFNIAGHAHDAYKSCEKMIHFLVHWNGWTFSSYTPHFYYPTCRVQRVRKCREVSTPPLGNLQQCRKFLFLLHFLKTLLWEIFFVEVCGFEKSCLIHWNSNTLNLIPFGTKQSKKPQEKVENSNYFLVQANFLKAINMALLWSMFKWQARGFSKSLFFVFYAWNLCHILFLSLFVLFSLPL